jgi:hypothetical protein
MRFAQPGFDGAFANAPTREDSIWVPFKLTHHQMADWLSNVLRSARYFQHEKI